MPRYELHLHRRYEAAAAQFRVPFSGMRGRSWPWVSSAVADAALAAGLVAAAQIELWAGGKGGAFLTAVALAGTAPIAFRRRWPLAVVIVVMAPLAALTVAGTDWFSYAQLLAMLVATYTVGAWAAPIPAAVGLVIALVAGVTNSLATAAKPEAGDVVFPLVLLAGPWLAGRALRLWRSRTTQLQRLTEQLTEEREARAALAVAAERARIAREMHDVLTQSLNAIVIHAEGAEEALARDVELARTPLATIQETGRGALRETRRMLGMLSRRPSRKRWSRCRARRTCPPSSRGCVRLGYPCGSVSREQCGHCHPP